MEDNKSLTTIIIVIVLIFTGIVAGSIFFIYLDQRTDEKKDDTSVIDPVSTGVQPEEVVISNISTNTAVVSWYTPVGTTGFVKYGTSENSANSVAYYSEESENSLQTKKIHYVKIRNLESNKKYYIEIHIDGTLSTANYQKSFVTYLVSQNAPTSIGKTVRIRMPLNFGDGVVYAHTKKSTKVSSVISNLVKSNNTNITLDLANLNDPVTGKSFEYSGSSLKISATDSNGQRTTLEASNFNSTLTLSETSSNVSIYQPSGVYTQLSNFSGGEDSTNLPDNVRAQSQENEEEQQDTTSAVGQDIVLKKINARFVKNSLYLKNTSVTLEGNIYELDRNGYSDEILINSEKIGEANSNFSITYSTLDYNIIGQIPNENTNVVFVLDDESIAIDNDQFDPATPAVASITTSEIPKTSIDVPIWVNYLTIALSACLLFIGVMLKKEKFT